MFEAALSGQGDHPRPHRQVEHRNSGEPSFGPHRQPTRNECLLIHSEGRNHFETQGGGHEPRGRNRGDTTDVVELEPLFEHPSQPAVENPHDHRHIGPALAEAVAHRQTCFKVGVLVGRQDRHRGGGGQVRRDQGLRLGSVLRDDRHGEGPCPADMSVVRIPLHHDDLLAHCDQSLDDGHSQRTEPHHDHMVGHSCHTQQAEGRSQPAADKEFGDQRVQDGHQRNGHDHDQDRHDPQIPGLRVEREVAVPDGRQRLYREIDRIKQVHLVVGGVHVPEHEDHRKKGAEDEQAADGPLQGTVRPVGQVARKGLQWPPRGSARSGGNPQGLRRHLLEIHQFGFQADQSHPVTDAHRGLTTRADRSRRVLVDNQDRRQFPEQVLQSARRPHLDLSHGVVVPGDLHPVQSFVQHRFHKGRRRQIRRVHNQPAGNRRCDSPAHRRIRLPDDDARLRSEFLHQQCGLQTAQIVVLDTHDAQSTSKTRGPQALGIARAGIDTGHIQCLHHAQMLFLCGGSDDDDPNACRSQQLHHPDAEPLHTAHDHVADPGPGVRRVHSDSHVTDHRAGMYQCRSRPLNRLKAGANRVAGQRWPTTLH